MKITDCFKVRKFVLAAVLGTGLGFVSPAFGQHVSYIVDSNGGGLTQLGDLGGSHTVARAINDAGQVAGKSFTAEGSQHAFITGPNGEGMTDLGTLGGNSSAAFGINDAGQVVGWSYTASGYQHAFITGPNGEGMTDLNSLVSLPAGVVLTQAYGINNLGQVIALAYAPPIPEPVTYAMMLAGLGLVGFMARRKKLEKWDARSVA